MDIVTRTILNFTPKCTGTILLRLCKRSHHGTIVNRAWTLNKLRSFPESYRIFLSCHRHDNNAINEMNDTQPKKKYYAGERNQMRLILVNYMNGQDTLFLPIEKAANVSFEEIGEVYRTDWSSKSVDEIIHALKLLTFFYSNGTRYEYQFFDSIWKACLAKLPEFEDDQIKMLLQCLVTLNDSIVPTPSYSRFMQVLDNECLKRFYPSTIKQLLLITDAFHQFHLYNSHYMRYAIKDLCTKPQKLSKTEFIQTSYYLSTNTNRMCVNMFEMEYHFRECIHQFSGNEMAIIARSFFLNRNSIRDKRVLIAIVGKTVNCIQSMDSVSIAYIMKLIRFSSALFCPQRFDTLLHRLIQELPRLSLPCLTHITHTFGALHLYNEVLTNGILKIVVENMHLTRIKDIERILFGICSVTPSTDYYTDICHKFVHEILSTYTISRLHENDK